MSRVWLCEETTAEYPFFLEEERINLYSFEELCYYLYQNTGVLEESFFNEKLCQWLEEELGQQKLAQHLRQGIEQEKSGCWCMEQILKASGLYSSEELQNARNTAARMEEKTPLERAKLRGDRLLKAEKYRDAIAEYRKILNHAKEPDGSEILGRIWHNIGTAYARQMLFAQAADCYGKAYETGQNQESREAYLLALLYRESQKVKAETDRFAQFKQELAEKKQSGDRTGYERALENMLQNLRTEYRKSV